MGCGGGITSVHSPCSSSAPKSELLMMQANTLQDMSAAIAAWRSPSLIRVKPAQTRLNLLKRQKAL